MDNQDETRRDGDTACTLFLLDTFTQTVNCPAFDDFHPETKFWYLSDGLSPGRSVVSTSLAGVSSTLPRCRWNTPMRLDGLGGLEAKKSQRGKEK